MSIPVCWLLLYKLTSDDRYLEAGISGNRYVRRTIKLDVPDEVRGGIKGSYPVSGDYGSYEYLSWAAKFLVDSQMLELTLSQANNNIRP